MISVSWTTYVGVEQLAEHLHDPGWVVCDCRFELSDPAAGERAYAQGHIPGAYYAHLDRDLSCPPDSGSGRHPLPDPDILAARLRSFGISSETQVVVYDQSAGMIAARCWWLLRWLGHEAVAVLDGGWAAWSAARLSVTSQSPQPRSGTLAPRPRREDWVSTAQLQQLLADEAVLLLDARSAERFRGEQEPIDPIAGHIPGARNHPCQSNVDSSGKVRSPAQLRAAFEAQGAAAAACVHMCGSGVTACHNLLAMEHAGLGGSRLYVGSWSEWIRDPKRPVARDIT